MAPAAFASEIQIRPTTGAQTVAVEVSGRINHGDAQAFGQLSVRLTDAVIDLSGPGGSLDDGLRIGRTIHQRHFATYVGPGQHCASACALIWLAGEPRLLAPGAEIGLHAVASYTDTGTRTETHAFDQTVQAYLDELRLPDDAIWTMVNTPSRSIRFFDGVELAANGIASVPYAGPADALP